MNDTVLDHSLAFRGQSKIPRLDTNHQSSGKRETNQYRDNGHEKSKLQLLQAQYQQKITRENEEKMVQQQAQQKASRGTARDFFNQRRMMKESGNISQMPSMTQHYRQTRGYGVNQNNENSRPHINSNHNRNDHDTENIPRYKKSYVGMMKKPPIQPQFKKMSAGRDRANPLAPIERNNSQDSGYSAPIPRKPVIHGRPPSKESQRMYNKPDAFSPHSAPTPNNFQNETPSPSSSKRRIPAISKQANKNNDFMKWQKEQEEARAQRLKQYHQRQAPQRMESDGEDEGLGNDSSQETEVDRKQAELMAQIARQQAELDRMKKENEQEEIQKKKERMLKKKQDDERKRKAKQEEEKRKRREAEERRREEQEERERREDQAQQRRIDQAMRQEEEEQRRRENQNQKSHRTVDSYDDGYDERESHYNQTDDRTGGNQYKDPSPPSKPKPSRSNVRKQQQQPSRSHPSVSDSFDEQAVPQTSARATGDLAFFQNAAKASDAFADRKVKMAKCSNCGRTFAEDRLQKHKNACKNITKKRKVMDPALMRTEGTEMQKYQGRARRAPPPKKNNNWRKKHDDFQKSIAYAKKMTEMEKQGVNIASLPPPPPSDTSDYVQCQYCSRRFNAGAAERHIPKCKELKTKAAPLKFRK